MIMRSHGQEAEGLFFRGNLLCHYRGIARIEEKIRSDKGFEIKLRRLEEEVRRFAQAVEIIKKVIGFLLNHLKLKNSL
ncbi:MAG: hypothetical protein QXN96_06315 [Candidatus Bathyarchaeia archaeon]